MHNCQWDSVGLSVLTLEKESFSGLYSTDKLLTKHSRRKAITFKNTKFIILNSTLKISAPYTLELSFTLAVVWGLV